MGKGKEDRGEEERGVTEGRIGLEWRYKERVGDRGGGGREGVEEDVGEGREDQDRGRNRNMGRKGGRGNISK